MLARERIASFADWIAGLSRQAKSFASPMAS
jgi:hypothetical protein